MHELNPLQAARDSDVSKAATQFRRPDNCSVEVCSAIVMYKQALERHRATIASLRASVLREADLLRQKDELLQQKEVLAKEAEHRLLNALQLIKSVLAMQSRGTENPEAAAQLNMAAQRVSTLSRVHQHLHAMDTLESVEFKQYLERLCHDLSNLVPNDTAERSLYVEGAEMTIPRVVATPLAFIASEMITNSIKYAKGKITVSLQRMPNGDAALSVSDDGPGLPEAFNPAVTKGLGMRIISALAEQIHGELNFGKGDHNTGARFPVRFRSQA